jgi:hypothetical protein
MSSETGETGIGGQRTEDRRQKTEDRSFKALNIEQQNKEPQNDEVFTSIFEIPCSIFCGSQQGRPPYLTPEH